MAGRIEADKENTILIDGAGERAVIEDRITSIRTQIADATYSYDKTKLGERLAKLDGGVAVLRVGAATETEMKEKKDRIDDALHATRAAVEDGIVAGGGVALVRAIETVKQLKGATADQDAGIKLIVRAMEEPLRQIVTNAGASADVVIAKVAEGTGSFGYNAATGEYGDLVEMGVIDPTKVTKTALINAASVAGLLLTTDCSIHIIPKDDGGQMQMPMGY